MLVKRLHQGLALGGMALDSGGDEIRQIRIARFIKGRADPGEHLSPLFAELGFSCGEGQLLHFGLADVTWLVTHCGRSRCGDSLVIFSKRDVIHGFYYTTPQKFVNY